LDDGKDPDKKTWVESLKDPDMLYTPGHIKTGPEVNGKACNLNSTLRALFPAGSEVGLEEVWLALSVWTMHSMWCRPCTVCGVLPPHTVLHYIWL